MKWPRVVKGKSSRSGGHSSSSSRRRTSSAGSKAADLVSGVIVSSPKSHGKSVVSSLPALATVTSYRHKNLDAVVAAQRSASGDSDSEADVSGVDNFRDRKAEMKGGLLEGGCRTGDMMRVLHVTHDDETEAADAAAVGTTTKKKTIDGGGGDDERSAAASTTLSKMSRNRSIPAESLPPTPVSQRKTLALLSGGSRSQCCDDTATAASSTPASTGSKSVLGANYNEASPASPGAIVSPETDDVGEEVVEMSFRFDEEEAAEAFAWATKSANSAADGEHDFHQEIPEYNRLDVTSTPTKRIVNLFANVDQVSVSEAPTDEAAASAKLLHNLLEGDAASAAETTSPLNITFGTTADATASTSPEHPADEPVTEDNDLIAVDAGRTPPRQSSRTHSNKGKSKSLMKSLARNLSPGRGLGRSKSPSSAAGDGDNDDDGEDDEFAPQGTGRQQQSEEDRRWLSPVSQQVSPSPSTVPSPPGPPPSQPDQAAVPATTTKPQTTPSRGMSRSFRRRGRSRSRSSRRRASSCDSAASSHSRANASIIATAVDDAVPPAVETAASTDAGEGVLRPSDGPLPHPAAVRGRSSASSAPRRGREGPDVRDDDGEINARARREAKAAPPSPARSVRSMLQCDTSGGRDGIVCGDGGRSSRPPGGYAIMNELGVNDANAAGRRKPVSPPTPPRKRQGKSAASPDPNNNAVANANQDWAVLSEEYTYTYGSPTAKDVAGKRLKGGAGENASDAGATAADLLRVQSDVSSLSMPLDLQTAALGYDRNGDPVPGACGVISPKLKRALDAAKRGAREQAKLRRKAQSSLGGTTSPTDGTKAGSGSNSLNDDDASVLAQSDVGCDGLLGKYWNCLSSPKDRSAAAAARQPGQANLDNVAFGDGAEAEGGDGAAAPLTIRRAEFEFMPGIEAPGIARAKREARRMGREYVPEKVATTPAAAAVVEGAEVTPPAANLDGTGAGKEQGPGLQRRRSRRRSRSRSRARGSVGGADIRNGVEQSQEQAADGGAVAAAAPPPRRSVRSSKRGGGASGVGFRTMGVLDLVRDIVCSGPRAAPVN